MTVESDDILLRKKARRRLIGAVLLTLVVVLSLPLVLEDPSRPLGDGPEIVIPEPAALEPPRAGKVPDGLQDETVGEEVLPVESGAAPAVGASGPAKPAAAPPPPKPAAATPPPERPETSGETALPRSYVLQLGVFKDRANAESVAAKASALGLQPAIAQTEAGAWRVGLGPYADRAEAFAARDKVREAGLPVVVKTP